MAECIFCRIVAGATAAEVVYEASGALAFLDKFPSARGHTLVIPRAHAPTLLELDDAAVGDLFRAVKAVTRKLQEALGPMGFNIGWNHGAAAGQHVFHLHVHILPRYGEGGRGVQSVGGRGAREDLAGLSAVIRAAQGERS
jgi:histidine triad (HIT) family protein